MFSAALPGLGQIRLGKRRLGLVLAATTVALILASLAAFSLAGPIRILSMILDPDVLLALVALNLVVASVRVWSTMDAWVEAGGRIARLGLLVLVLLVAMPHAALGYYALQTRETLLTVFQQEPPPVTAGTTTTTSSTSTTTVPSTTVPGPRTSAPSTTTTTTPPSPPLGKDRITLLLLGGDAGPGRPGLRTDTVMVASVDTRTGDAVLFGLPRNMGGFTFSDGTPFPGASQGILNEVYMWGLAHPERFPGVDPGAAAVMDVASHLLALPIDNFILVDMRGFAEMIDALGGVTVEVPRTIEAPLYNRRDGTYRMVTISAGTRHLDGDHALAFSRSRTGSDDYDRMSRQRCLLAALAAETEPLKVFARFGDILDVTKRRVTTDLPLGALPDLINLAPLVDRDRILVVGFDRDYWDGLTETGLHKPDVDKIRSAVRAALENSTDGTVIPSAEQACG